MTENYRELFETFLLAESLGVELSVRDGKLYASPAERITAALADQVRAHKPRIKASLERSGDLPPCRFNCSASLVAIATFDGFENFECPVCGKCSGCRRR